MVLPKVVNLKKSDTFDLYIGRKNVWLNLEESKWANPFRMKNESEREKVLEEYENYIRNNDVLINSLHELEGKVLGCYCSPLKKCHGEVLIKIFKEIINVN